MKNGPISEMDPRSKLFFASTVIILAIMIPKIMYLLGLLVLVFLVVSVGKTLKSWFEYLSALKWLIPILFFLNLFFYAGGEMIESFDLILFTLPITRGGLFTSITILLRLFSIAAVAAMFTVSTDAVELETALTKLKIPWRLAFILSLSLKLVPEIKKRYRKIRETQISRGLETGGGPIKRVKSKIPILIPFMVSVIRYGYELSEALEARGFNDVDGRTNLIQLKHGLDDLFLYLLSISIFSVYFYLNFIRF